MKLMCGGGSLLFKKLITNVKWKGNSPICIFMAWMSNESRSEIDWHWAVCGESLFWQPTNGNCLLTDIFSGSRIMSLRVSCIDFGWHFWTALIRNLHHFVAHVVVCTLPLLLILLKHSAVLVPAMGGHVCSVPQRWACVLLFPPCGQRAERWQTIFECPGRSNDASEFMKMLLRRPQHDGKIPRRHVVMDCAICPQTLMTSVTALRGKQNGVAGDPHFD